jgi:hypothetical protein
VRRLLGDKSDGPETGASNDGEEIRPFD